MAGKAKAFSLAVSSICGVDLGGGDRHAMSPREDRLTSPSTLVARRGSSDGADVRAGGQPLSARGHRPRLLARVARLRLAGVAATLAVGAAMLTVPTEAVSSEPAAFHPQLVTVDTPPAPTRHGCRRSAST